MTTDHSEGRRTALAAALALAGGLVLGALFWFQDLPRPLWLWAVFAAVFAVLEFTAVEVNDRLLVSSSIMVAFTAAVAFGRDSAVLAVVAMAAVTVLDPRELRRGRWRQPAANFGQLVVSSTVGIAVFTVFLPQGQLTVAHMPAIAGGAALAGTVYTWLNFRLVSAIVRRLYPDRTMRPWSKMVGNQIALAVLGGYGALLGAGFELVGAVTLPLMLVTFLVGHVGFAAYSQLREAHEATIQGFVKAVEALDPYTRGHTERVAHFAQVIGEGLGFGADRLERLRWAALIHDVGKVAVPPELLHRAGELTDEERASVIRHMQVVEGVLADVEFLAPMVEVASANHDVGRPGWDPPVEARILATADGFDAMTSTRSYRAAVTQQRAFAELRRRAEKLGADVVEALIGGIEERGEVYGSPTEDSSAEVERLVRERAVRA